MAKLTLEKIKKSKSYLFLNASKVRRNLSSITIGVNKHNKEIDSLYKLLIKNKNKLSLNREITVRIPTYNIYINILKDVQAINTLLDKINNGKLNLDYFKKVQSLASNKDVSSEMFKSIYSDMVKDIDNTIGKVPMSFVGIDIKKFKLDNTNITDFRINHKNPDWREHLTPSKLSSLKYPEIDKILDNTKTIINISPYITKLNKAQMNVKQLEKQFYKITKYIENLYNQDNKYDYLVAMSCLLSIYYLAEITEYKSSIWYNILLKYTIILLKHIKIEKQK